MKNIKKKLENPKDAIKEIVSFYTKSLDIEEDKTDLQDHLEKIYTIYQIYKQNLKIDKIKKVKVEKDSNFYKNLKERKDFVFDVHGKVEPLLFALIKSGFAKFKENASSVMFYDTKDNKFYNSIENFKEDSKEFLGSRLVMIPNLEINKDYKGTFIVGGDEINKGNDSLECVCLLNYLQTQEKQYDSFVRLIGDHESYMSEEAYDTFTKEHDNSYDIYFKCPVESKKAKYLLATKNLVKNNIKNRQYTVATFCGEKILVLHTFQKEQDLRKIYKVLQVKEPNKDCDAQRISIALNFLLFKRKDCLFKFSSEKFEGFLVNKTANHLKKETGLNNIFQIVGHQQEHDYNKDDGILRLDYKLQENEGALVTLTKKGIEKTFFSRTLDEFLEIQSQILNIPKKCIIEKSDMYFGFWFDKYSKSFTDTKKEVVYKILLKFFRDIELIERKSEKLTVRNNDKKLKDKNKNVSGFMYQINCLKEELGDYLVIHEDLLNELSDLAKGEFFDFKEKLKKKYILNKWTFKGHLMPSQRSQ